ncbi:WGR domain-containing protein, partial [Lentzea sp. NPDC060358]|uniref:WGR domain-containing protein n=1 Tax=Lentzea sp. NPDC060358 TaxID=3347103 RepID=UPI0036534FB4
MRRWELVSGSSAKFWEIGRTGTEVTVRFGRLDTNGQTQTKDLASTEAAEAHVAKLVADKEKKGYRAVTGASAPSADSTATSSTATTPSATTSAATNSAGTNSAGTNSAATSSTATAGVPAPATTPSAADSPVEPATATEPAAATPVTTEPATAPRQPASGAKPLPADEDTWTIPRSWLRDAVRQRGVDPAPEFAVDAELAEEARRRVGKQAGTTIERILSEPASDPDLVRAAREHLAGRPDPVWAAAVAAIFAIGEQSVHAWIADHGVV